MNSGIVRGASWDIYLSAGPRAGILLRCASKALAALRVRGFVVRRTPTPVVADEAVIARLLDAVPLPGPE